MKRITIACMVTILAGLMACSPVWARGGGHGGGGFGGGHFGGGFGGGHWGGGFHGGGWGHHHGFGGFGIGFGFPGYYGGYYPYGGYGGYGYGGYGYPSTTVVVPATPPVYIQQSPLVLQQYQSGYWYYCGNPEGYYPYIKECLVGWQQVAPRPTVPQ